MLLLLTTIKPVSITYFLCHLYKARSCLQLHVHTVQREGEERGNITHHKAWCNERDSCSLLVTTRINIDSFDPLVACICLQSMCKLVVTEKDETTVIMMNSGINHLQLLLQCSSFFSQFQINSLNFTSDKMNHVS